MPRGYFEIGVLHPKHPVNLGTLWRSAYQLGAAGIFVIGQRYRPQASDTCKAIRHIPLRHYLTLDAWKQALPYSTMIVGIETTGEPLETFHHPKRVAYLLGAEDHGLTPQAQQTCHRIVALSAVRQFSFNVAVAGSLVMYHRHIQYGDTHAVPS